MKLYLDDERIPTDGWRIVRTAKEAKALLNTGVVLELSLDHDLSPQHYEGVYDAETGYSVLLWLLNKVREDRSFTIPKIYIHTQNIAARDYMLEAVKTLEDLARDNKDV